MQKPTWLDTLIQTVIDSRDPNIIAQTVATSQPFMEAIRRGLTARANPGFLAGPSDAQLVADEIRKVINET